MVLRRRTKSNRKRDLEKKREPKKEWIRERQRETKKLKKLGEK